MIQKIISEIFVTNEALTQGYVRYGERNFWYENDCGDQYLAELEGDPEKFKEKSAVCLCDVLGREHIEWRKDGELNACEGIWSDDLNLHTLIAGMCLAVLLTREAKAKK